MEIVIASSNLHKIRELREMLKSEALEFLDVISLLSFANFYTPPEDGDTFQEIAISKAIHMAKALNRWVIADDSGLVIPALKGAPGIHSRRYAGEDATDEENRKKLLEAAKNLTGMHRSAYYECSLALASPDGLKKSVRGICEGILLHEPRGRNGFGYDSLFVKYEYEKSFAEIDESTKIRISHRRKALEKLLPSLEMLRK